MERTPRQIRLLTAVLLFVTFLLGTAAGVGLARWSGSPRPHRPFAPFLPGPPGALHLTPAQEAKARSITESYRPKLDAVWRDSFPKLQALNEQMEKELREVLTPDQRKTLDEMKARHPLPPPGAGPHRPGGPRPGGGPFPGGPMPPGAPPPPGFFGPPPGALPSPEPPPS